MRLASYGHPVAIAALLFLSITLLAASSAAQAQHSFFAEDGSPSLNLILLSHLDLAVNDRDSDTNLTPGAGKFGDEAFREIRLAIHISANLGPGWSAFLEAETGKTDNDTRSSIERAIIKYSLSDETSISAGRFHTPVGWWNTFYHHGRWLQTTIDRPLYVDFGNPYVPSHFWGIQYDRKFEADSGTWTVTGAVGVGRAESILSPAYGEPLDGDVSYLLRTTLRPYEFSNWQYGASIWYEDVELPGSDSADEWILTAFINTRSEMPEIAAEYAFVRHDIPGVGEVDSDSWYVQLGQRIKAAGGKFKIYGRVEDLDVNEDDLLYAGIRPLRRTMVGTRYDFSSQVSLKMELRRESPYREDSFNALHIQISAYF